MSTVDFNDHENWFYERAINGKTNEAVRFAVDLLDSGTSHARIVSDVFATSQRHVGDRWQRNEISVADEHVATGVTESALYAVSSNQQSEPPLGNVVVACAEGDWHSIAGHMFSEQLRGAGLAVTFLGASTPSDEVARYIQRRRPDALIVTCNLAIFFSGVVSLANVAHALGIPVLVGGRAVKGAPERARRLGSDAAPADLADVLSTLAQWRETPPAVEHPPLLLDPRVAELESRSMIIAQRAFLKLSAAFAPMEHYTPRQRDRTLEDLRYIVEFMAAAEYMGDLTIFTEFLAWIDEVLRSRKVPRAALQLGLEALIPELVTADPGGGRLVREGLEFLANVG
ncbi:MAG: hypothetical protein HIU57_07330 [Acidobacteria bacterium]|nr:hypothetical protein [Acidobacteriota bacterium]